MSDLFVAHTGQFLHQVNRNLSVFPTFSQKILPGDLQMRTNGGDYVL